MALTVSLQVLLQATQTKTPNFTIPTTSIPVNKLIQLADGVTAGKADRIFAATRVAAGNDDLDLAGSLVDDFGQVTAFARVKALYIKAAVGNTGNVLVGAGSAPWIGLLNAAGTMTLRPDAGIMAWSGAADATGMVVTATTADILRIAPSSGSVTYDIAVIGASA